MQTRSVSFIEDLGVSPPTSEPDRIIPIHKNGDANKLAGTDRAFHDWYRFVLSYPPHLVQHYLNQFELNGNSLVLDPFCGTGTTLVEAKKNGVSSVGIEANPFPCFASRVKTTWNVDAEKLLKIAQQIAVEAQVVLNAQGIDDNPIFANQDVKVPLRDISAEARQILLKDSISPLPLHKTLVLIDCMNKYQESSCYNHLLLGLANALVFKISNLHFGPEVGVRNPKTDAPVVSSWLGEVRKISNDLRLLNGKRYPDAEVHLSDARNDILSLPEKSIDAIITSPPYPNEKDYTRTTRLESVLLGFIHNKTELRELKKTLLRSNTRGVYKADEDDLWIKDQPEILRIAEQIEERRISMGKTSGFEKLYGRVTKLYFGGMAKHLSDLRPALRPGAKLAYVVGDQASYLRVMIRTGQLLAGIAESLDYEVLGIDLFRTRLATATKEQLREEVLILQWKG